MWTQTPFSLESDMFLMNRFAHKRNTDVRVGDTIYRVGPGGFISDPEDEHLPLDVPDVDAQKLLQGRAWSQLDWDPTDPKNAYRFASDKEYPQSYGKGRGRPPRSMAQIKADYGLPDDKAKIAPINRQQLPPQAIGTGSKDGTLSGVEAAAPSDRHIMKSVDKDREEQSADMAAQKRLGITEEEFKVDPMTGEAAVGDGRAPASSPTPVLAPTAPPPPVHSAPAPSDPSPPAVSQAAEAQYPDVPVDGQNWPDPTPDMDIAYLKKMADAYQVDYGKTIGAKTLAKRVHKAMYE